MSPPLGDFIHDWAPLMVAVIVLTGYMFGSWRRGMSDSWKETVDLQAAEIGTFKEMHERMAREAVECKEGLALLRGKVSQLQQENAELRQMVMLEKVPPALAESLSTSTRAVMEDVAAMHRAQVEELTEIFREMLHPVAQGVSRLLTEGG